MSYFEFIRSCLVPEQADHVQPCVDPAFDRHDTSLTTEHPQLVSRLIT